MRLNTLTNQEIELKEAKYKRVDNDPITRPLGISEEEFTPDYIKHLEFLRKTDPDLFHKIKNGL